MLVYHSVGLDGLRLREASQNGSAEWNPLGRWRPKNFAVYSQPVATGSVGGCFQLANMQEEIVRGINNLQILLSKIWKILIFRSLWCSKLSISRKHPWSAVWSHLALHTTPMINITSVVPTRPRSPATQLSLPAWPIWVRVSLHRGFYGSIERWGLNMIWYDWT